MIVASALLVAVLAGAPASDHREMLERQCRYQWVDPGTWTDREERRTALCVLERWPVVSYSTLSSVIECESHWFREAYNPAGYGGLAQHDLDAWPARVRAYQPFYWDLDPRWTNSRTQLTVTVRMMGAQGLSPWSGCS